MKGLIRTLDEQAENNGLSSAIAIAEDWLTTLGQIVPNCDQEESGHAMILHDTISSWLQRSKLQASINRMVAPYL